MQVLWLTEPETWSPHATYQATRLFISNLNARLAQRFLSLVLLPHVRQDVREHQRLHFALFQALKKAAYKPDAFYKVRGHPGAAQWDLLTADSCTARACIDSQEPDGATWTCCSPWSSSMYQYRVLLI